MALGHTRGSNVQKKNGGYGYGLARSTSFGRKRVALTNVKEDFDHLGASPLKRQCSLDSSPFPENSALESLPQDILIRIVCGVEHDDLKRLFHVSKTIKEATSIAKKWHFEYSTPRKACGFRDAVEFEEESIESNEIEAPNAPKQSRIRRSRLNGKKLAGLSVNLFASGDEPNWPRRDLAKGMETEM